MESIVEPEDEFSEEPLSDSGRRTQLYLKVVTTVPITDCFYSTQVEPFYISPEVWDFLWQ